MRCQKCGREIPENSKFCTGCGAPVIVYSAQSNQQGADPSGKSWQQTNSSTVRLCPKCKAPVGENAGFCSACGSKVPQNTAQAASAGSRLSPKMLAWILTACAVVVIAATIGLLLSMQKDKDNEGDGKAELSQTQEAGQDTAAVNRTEDSQEDRSPHTFSLFTYKEIITDTSHRAATDTGFTGYAFCVEFPHAQGDGDGIEALNAQMDAAYGSLLQKMVDDPYACQPIIAMDYSLASTDDLYAVVIERADGAWASEMADTQTVFYYDAVEDRTLTAQEYAEKLGYSKDAVVSEFQNRYQQLANAGSLDEESVLPLSSYQFDNIPFWVDNGSLVFGLFDADGASIYPQALEEPELRQHEYEIVKGAYTWRQARQKCIDMGGHLVTISSQEEMNTVVSMAQNEGVKYVWLGGYTTIDGDGRSTAYWVTGEPFTFSVWYKGGPSGYDLDGTREDCLLLWYLDDYGWTWNDSRNDPLSFNAYKGRLAFVCEYGDGYSDLG